MVLREDVPVACQADSCFPAVSDVFYVRNQLAIERVPRVLEIKLSTKTQ